MKARDFAAFEQALGGDVRGIAQRILSQPRAAGLPAWEEQFLEARIFKLDFPALASWLAQRPRDPRLVIEAIVALAPKRDSLAAWHLLQQVEAIGCENWALLVERLQPLLELPQWDAARAEVAAPREVEPRASNGEGQKDSAGPIGWLVQHGVPRSELVDLALDGIVAPDVSEATLAEVIRWLGERLITRSAWESHGEAVLYRFHLRWGWDLLGPLFQLLEYAIERSRAEAGQAGSPAELARGLFSFGAPPAWTPALHEALARMLIRITKEAIERGESARAKATLAALLHLNPPSRVVQRIHHLLDVPGLPGLTSEVRALIELTIDMFRRESGRAASLEGILNALRELPLS